MTSTQPIVALLQLFQLSMQFPRPSFTLPMPHFGPGSHPIKKPSVSSHFYPNERHVSQIKFNGEKKDTYIPNLFLSEHTLSNLNSDTVHRQDLRHLLKNHIGHHLHISPRPPPPYLSQTLVSSTSFTHKTQIFLHFHSNQKEGQANQIPHPKSNPKHHKKPIHKKTHSRHNNKTRKTHTGKSKSTHLTHPRQKKSSKPSPRSIHPP